jgi:hypothetical protein
MKNNVEIDMTTLDVVKEEAVQVNGPSYLTHSCDG